MEETANVMEVETLASPKILASNGFPLTSSAAASARTFSTEALKAFSFASSAASLLMIPFASSNGGTCAFTNDARSRR